MTSPVEWLPDGTPHSPRFDDIYRSIGPDGQGGLAQAHHVFLGGCGLWPGTTAAAVHPPLIQANIDPSIKPAPNIDDRKSPHTAWSHHSHWHVLETGFGLGMNFLATWAAWRADAARPARLFFTSIEAHPVTAADLLRSAQPFPELHALAAQLAAQWQAMLPGVHRLVFEGGAVQLTLCVGDARAMLREIDVAADSVFLDGFSPRLNPEMWALPVIKGVARLARPGTRVATWTYARAVRDHLQQCGFVLERRTGLPPKRDCLAATYAPGWTPRHLAQLRTALPECRLDDRHAVVVGAGISGASVAASLVARGWRVTVLDAAATPAAGASGLPAGIFAPHVSPDDGRLAQLTRAGVRAMRGRCDALLTPGQDWAHTGVLELPVGRERRLPAAWLADAAPPPNGGSAPPTHTPHAPPAPHPGLASSRPAQPGDAPTWQADVALQRLLASEPLWHAQAGWVRPAQLVRAQLALPGVTWRGGCHVTRLVWQGAEAPAPHVTPAPAPTPGTESDAEAIATAAAQADAAAIAATQAAQGMDDIAHDAPPPAPLAPAATASPGTRQAAWALFNDHGQQLATADLVVLAAGPATAALAQHWCKPGEFPTHRVHGLVTLGLEAGLAGPAPQAPAASAVAGSASDTPAIQPPAQAPGPAADVANQGTQYSATPNFESAEQPDTPPISPVNGHGSMLRGIPGDAGPFWCTGASFLRELPRGFDAATIAAEHQANLDRLDELLPVTAPLARRQWRAGAVWHWHGARCTVGDRVPLVGPLHADSATAQATEPGASTPWICTAMGARGLTLAVLSGELLAARLHGEPLPIARSLAGQLAAHRFRAPETNAPAPAG